MSAKTVNLSESPRRGGALRHDSLNKATLTCFVPAIVLTTVFLIAVVISRVRVMGLVQDFQMELPAVTHHALHPGFLAFLVMLILLTVAKEYLVADRRVKLVANLAVCIAIVILGGMYWIALRLPFIEIGTNLT